MVKNIFPIIIVGLFAIISGFSLLHKGLLPTHDGEYHVVRFYEFYQTLQDGNWYPRWAPDLNNGYGIPLFNYVYPLPNYFASVLHFLGFSFIDSFKLTMFLASILGSIFFYLWTKQFWGVWGGMVGAIFYTYSPYHFLDIYIRGSVGEVWALAFFPAFLWSITKFIKHQQIIFFISSSIFLSLIIFSHNILALMFLPFALTYCGFLLLGDKGNRGDWRKWGKGIFIFLLGIGLSAIFWLPALLEKQYVTGLQVTNFSDHFPEFYQLIIPSWGSGFSTGNLGNQLSFQIGIANLTIVFISAPTFLAYKKKDKNRLTLLFFIVWFILIVFLMLKVSQPIWQYIPLMSYFQFPWRLLSLEILIASFLAGSVIYPAPERCGVYFWKHMVLAILLISLAFLLGIGYAKLAYYHYRNDDYYLKRSNFIDGTNSPGNAFNTVWMKRSLNKENEKVKFVKGEGKLTELSVASTRYRFNIVSNKSSEMIVHTAYFPGWKVFIDGKESSINLRKDGLIGFFVSQGEHVVDVVLLDTIIRKLASLITLISVFCIIGLLSTTLRGKLWRR